MEISSAYDAVVSISKQHIWLDLWVTGYPIFPCTMFLILSGEISGLPFRSPNIEIDYSHDSTLDETEAELLIKADSGDSAAQYELANCYTKKSSMNWQSKFRAAYWYKKAAEQGNPQAQTSYGLLLQKGNGVEKDEKEAVIWFEKASAQNNDLAQYALG
jgi:TPR repeat protein